MLNDFSVVDMDAVRNSNFDNMYVLNKDGKTGWSNYDLKHLKCRDKNIDYRTATCFINTDIDRKDYRSYIVLYSIYSFIIRRLIEDSIDRDEQTLLYKLLQNGMLPIYMPPTFFNSAYREFVLSQLVKKKIKFEQFTPISLLYGNSIDNSGKDIYVYREQVANLLQVDVLKLNMIDAHRRLIIS